MNLIDYASDPRIKRLLSVNRQPLRKDIATMYLYAADAIQQHTWHWLQFHFSQKPGHPVGLSIASRCARIETIIPHAGTDFIDKISSYSNRTNDRSHYQQILQVFAEILIIERLVGLSWPEDTAFFYEPKGKTGKRPELMVSTPDSQYLFEVKSPSLLDHQEKRARTEQQLPQRGIQRLDKDLMERDFTLPRDTPIKDFLVSSQKKFSDFSEAKGANILVIAWDDYIYEPISSLVGNPEGLLTFGSWHKDHAGNPISYPNVDGIIVVRHMMYFQRALADNQLLDRNSLFDFGSENDLPNVLLQSPDGREVPTFIKSGLRVLDHKDEKLQHMSEYHAQDWILWMSSR